MTATLNAATPARPTAARSTSRKVKPSVRLIRAWFGATGQLAPALAERQAARLFLTPRRRRSPAAPSIAGRSGYAFALQLGAHRLTAWSWGEGPLALLVHGWEGSAAHMAAAAGRLVGTGYRAVALDMPAHGHSSGRRTSLVEWLAVLRALPAALGRPDVVVGHSFGATALAHALAEGFPARRAILLAPPIGPRHFVTRARRFLGLPAHREEGMIRRIGDMVGRDIAEFDAGRAAAAIGIPGIILHDPEDPDVPWAHATEIARNWRRSRLIARPGVGHYLILNDPGTLDVIGTLE